MKITIIENKVVLRKVGRSLHIDIGDGRVLELYKYTTFDESAEEYDQDWEADCDNTRAILEKLTDEEKDELDEFINNIKM